MTLATPRQNVVLQMSDLHFGAGDENAHPFAELRKNLVDLIQSFDTPPVIVSSGDITYKARPEGYREAADFYDGVRRETGLERKQFVFCPGNHDYEAGKGFPAFDAFTYHVRRDKACTFSSHTCRLVEANDLSFVLLNSVHHRDHRYGLVDVPALRKLALPDHRQRVVAVTHHHLVPTEPSDVSTTRNAYELITAVDELEIPILLHGHQHMSRGLPVGKTPVHVFGVNSFNFHQRGGLNAVNVLIREGADISFSRRIFLRDGLGSAGARFKTMDEYKFS